MNKYHYFIMPFNFGENYEFLDTTKKEHFITIIAKDEEDCVSRLNLYLDQNNIQKSMCLASKVNEKFSDFKNEIKKYAFGGSINPKVFE